MKVLSHLTKPYENQQVKRKTWIFKQCPRNGNPLLLTTTKLDTPFTNTSVIPVRKLFDKGVGVGQLGGVDYLVVGCIGISVLDVVCDRSGKQNWFL